MIFRSKAKSFGIALPPARIRPTIKQIIRLDTTLMGRDGLSPAGILRVTDKAQRIAVIKVPSKIASFRYLGTADVRGIRAMSRGRHADERRAPCSYSTIG